MKFIHTADIHLGAIPDKGAPWSSHREQEIWDSFRRLIERVGEDNVELLLIAGDLFHRQPLKGELREVNYLFSTIPHTQVVLMAGNHDYIRRDSYYRDFVWNENVTFFKGQSIERVYLEELNTYVTGLSYEGREIRERIYDEVRAGRERGLHILLAHGGDEKHAPITISAMGKAGFDYVALGHIHKPGILMENAVAYSGALEPLDRNDTGAHGYIAGEHGEDGMDITFVPFAHREYRNLEIQSCRESSQSEMEQCIRQAVKEGGDRHLYTVTLVGTREEDTVYQLDRMKRLGNITVIEDYTEPALDMEGLLLQYEGTIIGEYIRKFKSQPGGCELKALYYGVQALLKTKR